MSVSPKVSIITPVFNARPYLVSCAESVLQQTLSDWEWIVVDNGSTDGSMEALATYTDARIHLLQEMRKGVSFARNAGLDAAQGDWIVFLDADDRLTPESLSSRIALATTNAQLDCIDGSVRVFTNGSENTLRTWSPNFNGIPKDSLLQLDGRCFFGPTWMVKRNCIQHRFDTRLTHVEDLLFYLQNCAHCQYGAVTDVILEYRSGHTSAMADLPGLERGYSMVAHMLGDQDGPIFRQKATDIMWKSYAKQGRIASAMRVWTKGLRV
ncbi:MAG: glycosyltransferase [Flavobacteriales bacterium]|nr:glycosyltransferase [Flavobacteriales bacterium]